MIQDPFSSYKENRLSLVGGHWDFQWCGERMQKGDWGFQWLCVGPIRKDTRASLVDCHCFRWLSFVFLSP